MSINRLKYRAPLQCSLNITGRCNLKCLHCSAGASPDYSEDMSTSVINGLIDQLVNMKIQKVHISGGEPILHKDFFKIIANFQKNEIPITLFTNATLLSKATVDELASFDNIVSISTSIDGASSETHDKLRGVGSYDLAINGIELLKEKGFKLHINCVISKLNYLELPEIAKLAKKIKAPIAFNPVAIVGRAKKNSKLFEFTNQELDSMYETVKKLRNDFKIVTGGVILEWPKEKVEWIAKKKLNPSDQHLASCDICKESVAIRPDGWVIPCNNFWEYKIGNILETDIVTIYRSEKAQKIRELTTLKSNQLEGCADCKYSCYCSGGCRANAFASSEYQSLMSQDKFRCIRRYIESSRT